MILPVGASVKIDVSKPRASGDDPQLFINWINGGP